jgi:hypothetical protein
LPPLINRANPANPNPANPQIQQIMIQDELTYKVIGCAMNVHSTLGNGFQEVIDQRCLAIELNDAGVSFRREVEQPIFYKGSDVGM